LRELGLQDVIRGIAAVRLEHEQRKFGSNTDEMGKKIDAKIAVKELKTGFKDMKRENGLQDGKVSKKETEIEIVYQGRTQSDRLPVQRRLTMRLMRSRGKTYT
jgi:hypothetical protein